MSNRKLTPSVVLVHNIYMTLLGFLKDFIWGGSPTEKGAKLYVWDWKDGGWNSGFATSLAEAKKLAKWMGTPGPRSGMKVTLVPVNVRLAPKGKLQVPSYD